MGKQLSKASHYDFGMRAVKSILRSSGRIKREQKSLDEFTVVIKALRDMNLPKFLAEDVVLFDALFMDLFPDMDEPEVDTDQLQIAIEDCMQKRNLQLNENIIVKVLQLGESKATRHGNMLVGLTQSGKSVVWSLLRDAYNLLNSEAMKKENKERWQCKYRAIKVESINPKSVNLEELYGYEDRE